MRSLFRVLRLGSIATFFSGIIAVIQGCSIEREGALFAALLLLIQFCTGITVEEPVTPIDPGIPFEMGRSLVGVSPVSAATQSMTGVGAGHILIDFPATGSGTLTNFEYGVNNGASLDGADVILFIARPVGGSSFEVVDAETHVLDGANCGPQACNFAVSLEGVEIGDFIGMFWPITNINVKSPALPFRLRYRSGASVRAFSIIPIKGNVINTHSLFTNIGVGYFGTGTGP